MLLCHAVYHTEGMSGIRLFLKGFQCGQLLLKPHSPWLQQAWHSAF